MKKTEFYIPSNDGVTRLHGYVWAPDVQPRFILQLVHGMVEYIDHYDAFASFLAANDIAVIGHDHLGHGKSVTDESKLGFFAEKDGSDTIRRQESELSEARWFTRDELPDDHSTISLTGEMIELFRAGKEKE